MTKILNANVVANAIANANVIADANTTLELAKLQQNVKYIICLLARKVNESELIHLLLEKPIRIIILISRSTNQIFYAY